MAYVSRGVEWLSPDECCCNFDLGDGGDGSEVHGRPAAPFTVDGITYDIDEAEAREATDIQPMITLKDDALGCQDYRSSDASFAVYQMSWKDFDLKWTPDEPP